MNSSRAETAQNSFERWWFDKKKHYRKLTFSFTDQRVIRRGERTQLSQQAWRQQARFIYATNAARKCTVGPHTAHFRAAFCNGLQQRHPVYRILWSIAYMFSYINIGTATLGSGIDPFRFFFLGGGSSSPCPERVPLNFGSSLSNADRFSKCFHQQT